jgi:hypothetical protein
MHDTSRRGKPPKDLRRGRPVIENPMVSVPLLFGRVDLFELLAALHDLNTRSASCRSSAGADSTTSLLSRAGGSREMPAKRNGPC